MGAIREKELIAACSVLRVREQRLLGGRIFISAFGGELGQNLTCCLHLVGGLEPALNAAAGMEPARCMGGHNLLHAPAPSS